MQQGRGKFVMLAAMRKPSDGAQCASGLANLRAVRGSELNREFDKSAPTEVAQNLELLVADLNGAPRGKAVNGPSFDPNNLPHLPAAVFLQCINGKYADAMEAHNPRDEDLLLRPDWSTYRTTPWKAKDCGQVICETLNKAGEPMVFDPRNLLQRMIGLYVDKGLRPLVAPEVEFYLLAPPKRGDLELRPAPGVDQRDEFGGEAFSSDALDKYAPFLDDVRTMCRKMNIPLQAVVHEMGPAQMELNIPHGDALARADEFFLLKRLVKGCAVRHGCLASFMAKPSMDLPGSGLHLHLSLVNDWNANVFALKEAKAPKPLRHFIGGLQTYLPAAFALVAPNVNSFKRFTSDASAPINLQWGYDNRTAGFRVPFGSAANGRVENRVAGADANPYLAIVAMLACGLLGMDEALEPSAPVDGDAYDLPANLPEDLGQALRRLSTHDKLRRILSKPFVDAFVSVKRRELQDAARQITPWELGYLGSLV